MRKQECVEERPDCTMSSEEETWIKVIKKRLNGNKEESSKKIKTKSGKKIDYGKF